MIGMALVVYLTNDYVYMTNDYDVIGPENLRKNTNFHLNIILHFFVDGKLI